jgi:hypothetical protein
MQIISFARRKAHIDACGRYGEAAARGSVAPKNARQWAANSTAMGLNLRLAKVASTSRLLETPALNGRATKARPS